MMAADPKGKARHRRSAQSEEPVGELAFYHAWCKHCGICVAFCPKQALALDDDGNPHLVRPERCNACGLCEVLCPDFAISVPRRGRKGE